MSNRLIILHTNDVHGRIDNLARIASKIKEIRQENPDTPVIYMDGGDIEDTSVRLSNLTKGTAMYDLLGEMGCHAGAIGNGSLFRYGPQILQAHQEAGQFPLLLANVRDKNQSPPLGVETRHVLHAGDAAIGLVGVTAPLKVYKTFFGLQMPSARHLVRDLAGSLWQDGVDLVILLSHLGLQDDIQLANKLQDVVNIIIGAHSHSKLDEGYEVGNVMIVQAGQYGEHLGRIDLVRDEDEMLVVDNVYLIEITEAIPQDEAFLQRVTEIEAQVETFLGEKLITVAHDLSYAIDRECAMGNLAADAMRHVMQADIGVAVIGQAFSSGFDAGPLTRHDLYSASDSSANPAITTLTGYQLVQMVKKGLNKGLAADDSVRGLRGRARGMMHISGALIRDGRLWINDNLVDPDKLYRVAATDFELVHNFGYVEQNWNLDITYAVPTIFREGFEAYLQTFDGDLTVDVGRIEGGLNLHD